MLLSEIFDYLVHGELSQLSIGQHGIVDTDDYPKVITAINMGLLEIYKRFPIKMAELNIDLEEHISMYSLHSDYAASNTASAQPYKYISDANVAEPFSDNIILITQVYTEMGEELPLNDLNEPKSVFTPYPTMLQVPFAAEENSLSVVYQAKPPTIDYTLIIDPEQVEVPVTLQFLEALTTYVAWRIFTPINLGDKTEADIFYVKFETACSLIDHLGLLNIDNTRNIHFGENGWL